MADIKTRIGAPFQISGKVKNSRTQVTVQVDQDDGAGNGTNPVTVKVANLAFVYKVTPKNAGTFTYTVTSTIPPAKKSGDPTTETKTTTAEVVAITSLRDWPGSTGLNGETLNAMRTNRSHVVANPGLRKSGKGFMYGGKEPAWPTGLPDRNSTTFDNDDVKIQMAVKKEVGGEGGASAINSWDGAILTWGSGFAHLSNGKGKLERWVGAFLAASEDGKNALLDYGITMDWDGSIGTWKVADTTKDDGPVLTGDDALGLFRTDASLCSVLIEVAEGKTAQAVEDAQWAVLKSDYITKIPAWMKSWDIMMIRFCLHATMWGFNTTWQTFQSTNGDKEQILRKEVAQMTGSAVSSCGSGGLLVNAATSDNSNFPAITVLHNLGAGTMLSIVTPLTADDAAKAMKGAVAGDIFFDHSSCQICTTKGFFRLKAPGTSS